MKAIPAAAAFLASVSISALAEAPSSDNQPTVNGPATAPPPAGVREPAYRLTRQHIFNATPDFNCIDGACRHAPNLPMEDADAVATAPLLPANAPPVPPCIDGACVPPHGPFAKLSVNAASPAAASPPQGSLSSPSPRLGSPRTTPPVPGSAAFDPNNPTASGMVLTFDDEFNSASWSADNVANGTRWTDHGINPGPDTPSNLSVHDGVLDMVAHNVNGQWTESMLSSVNSASQGFTQQFGYFEASIKIPAGAGSWPAWWLLDVNHFNGQNAPPNELDIMENNGGEPNQYGATIHDGLGNINSNFLAHVGIDLTQGYHRYGLLWDPNSSSITWYLDGKPIVTAPKYSGTDAAHMMVMLNEQISHGQYGTAPDGSTPDTVHMYVDYVRAWQFADQHPHALVTQDVAPPPAAVTPPVEPAPVAPPVPAPEPAPVEAAPVDATPTVPPVPVVAVTPVDLSIFYTGGA